jgi:UDP-2,3-diacylglucosamine hydrolase
LRAVFFSDVHLVREDTDKTELVQGFLKDCCAEADMVFILGDLFEFYHGYDGYIYPWYKGVIDALKELTENGKRVFFLEGNHEFSMGAFFEQYTGITCGQDMTIQLDEKKIFVSHGDASDHFCLGSILKTRFIYAIMDILGPIVTWKTAHAAGFFLSRKIKPYNKNIKIIFRENARKKLDEGYDAVIYAHSHIADKIEFDRDDGKKTYLNTGDFGKRLDFVLYDSSAGFTQEKYSRNVAGEKHSYKGI